MIEFLQYLEQAEAFKTGAVILALLFLLGLAAYMSIQQFKNFSEERKLYMTKIEEASGKFSGQSEKLIEMQMKSIESEKELAIAMEKKAEAEKAVADSVRALSEQTQKGFNDTAEKIEHAKKVIIDHIHIDKQKKNV